MTMKPGSSDNDDTFSDSLAEEIENALKMEWLARKNQPLPDAGKEDRRLFFSAIAQGLLNYLVDHSAELQITTVSGNPILNRRIKILSPNLKLFRSPPGGDPNALTAEGESFSGRGSVTVTWDVPATQHSVPVDPDGHFRMPFELPPGAAQGRHVVEARDEAGNVALAVFII